MQIPDALLLGAQYMELVVCAFSLTVVTVGLLLLDATSVA